MPRLVFCPTRAKVASTAAKIRAPTSMPGVVERDRGDMRAVDEILGLHAMAGGEDMDIAGLGRLQLVLAGGEEGLSQR